MFSALTTECRPFSIIGVCAAAFKIAKRLACYLPLWNRVIALFERYFLLYQPTKLRFFHCVESYKNTISKQLENLQANGLYVMLQTYCLR